MRRPRPRRPAGFTLIEMLVVMGIIIMLMAMLFPAIKGAINSAHRGRAMQDVKALETALKGFRSEYGYFPLQTGSADMTYDNATLVAILRGADTANNPRGKPFIEISANILQGGQFVDPWDNAYTVRADWDGNGILTMPNNLGSCTGRVATAWSSGPDGVAGSSDDVCSWK